MRYNLYRILLGVLLAISLIVFFWLSGYGPMIADRITTVDAFHSALAKVPTCLKHSDVSACERPFVIQMLKEKSGTDVMDALSKLIAPEQCHYAGHIVGQELYNQQQNVESALAMCDLSCDSACVHGVIGQAFAVALGHPDINDPNFDLEHLSLADINVIGKKLCVSIDACHGVGHTLFQIYKQLEPSFAMCKQVGGASISSCYNGAAMEYGDVLASRNMRAVPGVPYPDPKKFSSLCTFSDTGETRACFRYLPGMVAKTLEQNGVTQNEAMQQMKGVCASYTSADYRMSCFAGIGTYLSYDIRTNTAVAVRACEGFPVEFDQKACILGMVIIATEDRQQQLASYCAAQTTDSLKVTCYQGLFYAHYNRTGTQFNVAQLCGSDNGICAESAKKYEQDSWTLLKADFGK